MNFYSIRSYLFEGLTDDFERIWQETDKGGS